MVLPFVARIADNLSEIRGRIAMAAARSGRPAAGACGDLTTCTAAPRGMRTCQTSPRFIPPVLPGQVIHQVEGLGTGSIPTLEFRAQLRR